MTKIQEAAPSGALTNKVAAPQEIAEGFVSRGHTVVEFTDQFGDKRTIYRNKGQNLRIRKKADSPSHLLNRAAAIITGQRIRIARRAAGLGPAELLARAGLEAAPGCGKQRMYEIEKAGTGVGRKGTFIRMGTLYALALALDLEITDLLPTAKEVQVAAGLMFKAPAPRLTLAQAAE